MDQVRSEYLRSYLNWLHNWQLTSRRRSHALKGSHSMGDGRIFLKTCCDASFNKYLSNEPNFDLIHLAGQYTVTRRSAEFRHPARMKQDSSCYIGENDCFIWAGNLHPQVPKFSVITGNFTMKKGRRRMVGSNSVPLDYNSCPLPLDHGYHVINVKKYTLINIKYQRESKKSNI